MMVNMNECSTSTSSSSNSSSTGSNLTTTTSTTATRSSNNTISISQANNSNNNAKNKKLFPKKLWDLINNEKYYFCLRWSEDGQLVYLNRDEFEDYYLKTAENQFHTQKAISFVRQMNMYGFRKVDDCYYENDNFKRDCEHLLKNMIRKHPNKNQPRHAAATQQHHNHHLQHQHQHHLHHQQQQQQQQHQQLINEDLMAPKLLNVSNSVRATNNLSDLGAHLAGLATGPLVPELSGSDLQTFYALLSSLSGNFCTSSQPNNYQAAANLLDGGGKFAPAATLPQQIIYQSLLAQQEAAVAAAGATTTITKDLFPHAGLTMPIQLAPKRTVAAAAAAAAPLAPSQQNLLDRVTSSATSLLGPPNGGNSTGGQANDLSLKHLRSNGTSAADSLLRSSPAANEPMSLAKRRADPSRTVRSFKRSVDSILDSSDTNNANTDISGQTERNSSSAASFSQTTTTNKRMKMEFYHHPHQYNNSSNSNSDRQRPVNLVSGVNELAKNLVSEIALSRDAHLDSDVLLEASKYTQGFVQTLFDTALLIARHSNGLNLSDYMLTADTTNCHQQAQSMTDGHDDDDDDDAGNDDDDDRDDDGRSSHHQHEPECERSNISVSDLTSALKLLPSKLLKILK